jgi:hypothetical protein
MLSVPYALYAGSTYVSVSPTGDTLTVGEQSVIVPGISAANYPTQISGCTNALSCNYDSAASRDDGSCLIQGATCDDGNTSTSNDIINSSCVCSGINNFSIGQSFEGGKIVYIFQPGDLMYVPGEVHGIIAAIMDIGLYRFGCYDVSILGADATGIGYGLQNTLDIENHPSVYGSGCHLLGILVAAHACSELVLNGFSDWFLPSANELYQLYLAKDLIGGFTNSEYWSSSELQAITSWTVSFGDGTVTGFTLKSTLYNVRPIRYF